MHVLCSCSREDPALGFLLSQVDDNNMASGMMMRRADVLEVLRTLSLAFHFLRLDMNRASNLWLQNGFPLGIFELLQLCISLQKSHQIPFWQRHQRSSRFLPPQGKTPILTLAPVRLLHSLEIHNKEKLGLRYHNAIVTIFAFFLGFANP